MKYILCLRTKRNLNKFLSVRCAMCTQPGEIFAFIMETILIFAALQDYPFDHQKIEVDPLVLKLSLWPL